MYKGAVKKGWANTVGKMEDVYQVEDQVFRMAVFMDRLSKGKGIREAAMDSKRWFIDYDINAPAIPPEASPNVLFAPSVTLQTGCVIAFQDIVEASVKVASAL